MRFDATPSFSPASGRPWGVHFASWVQRSVHSHAALGAEDLAGAKGVIGDGVLEALLGAEPNTPIPYEQGDRAFGLLPVHVSGIPAAVIWVECEDVSGLSPNSFRDVLLEVHAYCSDSWARQFRAALAATLHRGEVDPSGPAHLLVLLTGADAAIVWRLDDGQLRTVSTFGIQGGQRYDTSVGRGIIGRVASTERAEIIDHLDRMVGLIAHPVAVREERWASAAMDVVPGAAGQPIGAAGVYSRRPRAFTETSVGRMGEAFEVVAARFEAQALEDRARALAERLVEPGAAYTAGIAALELAHDAQQRLSTVTGYLSTVRSWLPDQLPNARQQLFDSLARDLEQVTTRLRRIVALSRSRPRRARDECDAAEVLADVVALWAESPDNAAIRFQDDYPDALRIGFDGDAFFRVMFNLIGNAVYWSRKSRGQPRKPLIRVIGSRDPQHRVARFSVWDNGRGIPREELPRVFEPFFSRRANGTGIGLAYCKRVVEDAGGKMSVASKWGFETEFTVTLPLAEESG